MRAFSQERYEQLRKPIPVLPTIHRQRRHQRHPHHTHPIENHFKIQHWNYMCDIRCSEHGTKTRIDKIRIWASSVSPKLWRQADWWQNCQVSSEIEHKVSRWLCRFWWRKLLNDHMTSNQPHHNINLGFIEIILQYIFYSLGNISWITADHGT